MRCQELNPGPHRHVQHSPIKPHPWVPYLAFLHHVCTEQHEHVRPHLLQKFELQQSHLSNGPLTCFPLMVWPCLRPERPSRAKSSQGPKGCTERPHVPKFAFDHSVHTDGGFTVVQVVLGSWAALLPGCTLGSGTHSHELLLARHHRPLSPEPAKKTVFPLQEIEKIQNLGRSSLPLMQPTGDPTDRIHKCQQ